MADYITLDQLKGSAPSDGGYVTLGDVRKQSRADIASEIDNDAISKGARNFASEGWGSKYLSALGGAVRGAAGIGTTLLTPVDAAVDAIKGDRGPTLSSLITGQKPMSRSEERRASLDPTLESLGADPNSLLYKGGKLGAEIAGTSGVGGMLANGLRAALPAVRSMEGMRVLNGVAQGLETGGFRVGGLAGSPAGLLARAGTGAAVGGVSAGMVNPEDVSMGAMIGGGLPLATKAAGALGGAIRRAIAPEVSPEVRQLAQRADELGINIPADRLTNSRPLNAVAAGLNYVPFSGRAATEDAMTSQLNRALSRTFGQDSSNVTQALRKADDALGGKFDAFLRNNSVKVDPQFMDDLAQAANRASRELGSDGASIISKQIDDIVAKAGSGQIDGQAAYNIKKTLDRIGNRNSPEAWYALDLKGKLMDALNRSVGTDAAGQFAGLRKQYGNMLELQKLAKNGAEGEVSVARLANMKNIRNPEMQELADIAAQFVKPREGAHGAAQRATAGAAMFGLGGLPGLLAGAATGRATNMALNSQVTKGLLMNPSAKLLGEAEPLGLLSQSVYRTLPLVPAE